MQIKNLRVGNLQLVESGKLYGNMNKDKKYFPDWYSSAQIEAGLMNSKIKLGKSYGFDGHKVFSSKQEDKRGTCFLIDDEYIKNNPNGCDEVEKDILIVTKDNPGVVIGHAVNDYPIVVAYDYKNEIAAISYCDGENIDKKIPMLVVDSLYNYKKSKDSDIVTYISACAGQSLAYKEYPKWAKYDDVWDSYITLEKDSLYHVDLKGAIYKQLQDRKVAQIFVSNVDTVKDTYFFSDYATKNLEKTESGTNFSGAFLKIKK